MDSRNVVRATLVVALSIAATAARAEIAKLELCVDPVEISLRQPGAHDLQWTLCGDDGALGDASADWDSDREEYSEEFAAKLQAEESSASGAKATRRGSAVDFSAALTVAGKRRELSVDGLAIGAMPRAVPGVRGATLQAMNASGAMFRLDIDTEKPSVVAQRLAEVGKLRIDDIDRLSDAQPMSLRFNLVSARTALQFVADVGGTALLAASGNRFGFATAAQAKARAVAGERMEALRGGDDKAGLEAALERYVAAVPMSAEGPVPEIRDELDQLARLLGGRKDYAGAERLQRQRLALCERIDGSRKSLSALEALDQIATLRLLQDDNAGAKAMFREVTVASELFAGGMTYAERLPVAHAWVGLGTSAMMERDDVASERSYARATALVREIPIDRIEAVESSNVLSMHAVSLELLDRDDEAAPLLERHLAIMRANYGEKSSMAGMAMEDLARNVARRDDLVGAAGLYVDALAIRTAAGEASERVEGEARETLELVAALGPFARAEPGAGAVAKLRKSLESDPPSQELLSRMTALLEKRAAGQRGEPALAVTCDGYAELVAMRVRLGRGGTPELLARATDLARRDCLAPAD